MPRWRQVATNSPATQSRGQWRGAIDDTGFHKYGRQLSLVGRWWSGQPHRGLAGIDGLWLVVVLGAGKRVVPVAFVMRRPDPPGPGAPCRDTVPWARTMRAQCLAACRHRGLTLPPPMLTGESWVSDSKLMTSVPQQSQGPWLVEGKTPDRFTWADGRHVHSAALLKGPWRWRAPPWQRGVRYGRLRATRPTDGVGTRVIVDEPGEDRFSLLCLETTWSGPQRSRRWRRRPWIEWVLRVLKHLLATAAWQAHSDDVYSGPFVLRLLASFVLCDTSRVVCKGSRTMEEIILSLQHDWRFVDREALALQALSSGSNVQTA